MGPFDFLVVGCGFSGATLAERLANVLGMRVCLIDRRNHIGGNAGDTYDTSGILIHRYGPHIFHTDDGEVFRYLSNFTGWLFYEHRVRASLGGELLPIPINLDTVNRLYGLGLDSRGLEEFFDSVRERITAPKNSREMVTSQVGLDLYEKFFKNYTEKMWGMDPGELSPEVTGRIPVRMNRDDRYFTDRYQFMPDKGYTTLFQKMLEGKGIQLLLDTDFSDIRGKIEAKRIIYTGPLDEYFDYSLGKLPYRSLDFRFENLEEEWHQPVAVVNYPGFQDYTRVTEYKHLTGQNYPHTTISYEYPRGEGDPYYPVPTPGNEELSNRYRMMANNEKNTYFAGRLAEYRYYTMTDVVRRALDLFEVIKKEVK
jgi:UDP-galactopyranose mutase